MSDEGGLQGEPVVDKAGAKLGTVDGYYADRATGRPLWVKVKSRWLHHRKYFVALRGARTDGKKVVVAFDKETVRRAPLVDHEGSLTPSEDAEIGAYYARETDKDLPT